MGVKVTSRTYSNPFRAETTSWLLGNVGTWQKLVIEFSVSVDKEFSLTNPLQYERPNKFTLSDGTEWKDAGFAVGDSVTLVYTETNYSGGSPVDTPKTLTKTISSLSGAVMETSAILGDLDLDTAFIPMRINDTEYSDVVMYSQTQPEGFDFFYNHLTNDNVQSNSIDSFIDGTQTGFSALGVDLMAPLSTQLMGDKVTQSGMSIKSNPVLTYAGNVGRFYNYSIELVYMISSFFEDISNFEDNTPPSQTENNNCLTDNFLITAYPTLNNPNLSMSNDLNDTQQEGSTGWFNENFNNNPNILTLDSLVYKNSAGEVVDQLDYASEISVIATIGNIANLSTLSKCAFGFMWVPIEEDIYKNLPTSFADNVKMSTGGAYFSDVFNVSATFDTATRLGYSIDDSRMDVKDVRFSDSSGDLVFEATFIPTAAFAAEFASKTSDRNYILWVSAADRTLDTNHSDRVSLLLDFRQLETDIPVVGEYEPMSIAFLDHTKTSASASEDPCGVDIRIEDDLLAKVEFSIDTLAEIEPKAMTFAIIAERASDNEQYILESYPVDLSQFPRVANIPQYNFDEIRGFKLPEGNNKNFVKVIRDAPNDSGVNAAYLGLYGFKIRWEDWIKRTGVPADFFSITELNNGENNDWYQYLSVAGWNMFFVVWIDATIVENNIPTLVRYENKKELTFEDYDSNADITTAINYYRQSTGSLLIGGTDPVSGLPLGVLLEDELVRIEIVYTRGTGTWADVLNSYGVTTLEVDQGAGFKDLWQISTEYIPETDNPLQPIPTETELKIELVSPTVIKTSCLVDSSKIADAIRYKITGRLGCK